MVLRKVSDHFLVPKHEIVPEERAGDVLKRYRADIDKLPRILRTDPLVEETGAKRGNIIKITRNSSTAGKSIFFRVVM